MPQHHPEPQGLIGPTFVLADHPFCQMSWFGVLRARGTIVAGGLPLSHGLSPLFTQALTPQQVDFARASRPRKANKNPVLQSQERKLFGTLEPMLLDLEAAGNYRRPASGWHAPRYGICLQMHSLPSPPGYVIRSCSACHRGERTRTYEGPQQQTEDPQASQRNLF